MVNGPLVNIATEAIRIGVTQAVLPYVDRLEKAYWLLFGAVCVNIVLTVINLLRK